MLLLLLLPGDRHGLCEQGHGAHGGWRREVQVRHRHQQESVAVKCSVKFLGSSGVKFCVNWFMDFTGIRICCREHWQALGRKKNVRSGVNAVVFYGTVLVCVVLGHACCRRNTAEHQPAAKAAVPLMLTRGLVGRACMTEFVAMVRWGSKRLGTLRLLACQQSESLSVALYSGAVTPRGCMHMWPT
jgi:hypothetical protein